MINRVEMRRMSYGLRHFAAERVAFLARAFPSVILLQTLAENLRFVRSRYGVLLLNQPADLTFQFCVRGGYGPFIADIIAAPRPPFVFLDIGANMGLFSLLAARNSACRRVVAIEPIPVTFHALQANIRRNHATNIVPVMGAVASGSETEIRLAYNPRHSGMSARVPAGSAAMAARVIGVAALDALIGDNILPVIAKIDVEGAECDVLGVLADTRFYGRIMDVIVEISAVTGGVRHQQALVALLVAAGFAEASRSGPADHYDAWYRRSAA